MKRILIIDDDEDILEIFNLIFQNEGYNVVLSNNGDAAENIFEIGPDLVILDVRIVGSVKNGGEICSDLKEKFKDARLPVILISAEHDVRRIASECGADAYLNKPFDLAHLLTTVKELLN